MSSFGFLGSAYMFFLVALLVVALGAGTSFLLSFFTDTVNGSKANQQQFKGGSIVMENNPWLKYALYSFLGILILVAMLGLVMPGQNQYSSNMMPMGNTSGRVQMGGGGGMPMNSMPAGGSGGMSGMMPNNQMAQMQSASPMGNSTMPSGGMQMNGVMVVPLPNGGVAVIPMNNGMASSGMQTGNMPMNNMPGGGGGGMAVNAMPAGGSGMGMMPMGGGGGMPMSSMPAGGASANTSSMPPSSSGGGGMGMM